MYNKLFTKILDSSIWLAPSDIRIVWITFIAAMDEDGIVRLATVRNVANRALVPVEAAEAAIATLEAPDPETPDCPFQGRRIERVPGGWLVLKAGEYREMVSRQAIREQTRERVARHRAKKNGNAPCNADVTQSDQEQIRSEKRTVEQSPTVPTAEEPEDSTPDEVREVFAYWQEVMNSPRSQLSPERRRLIRSRLKDGYSVEDLKRAIFGCSVTPFNMGMNDRDTKFNGIDVIFKNADKVDRFIASAQRPPTIPEEYRNRV